ncbi:unnamed protein product [Echinostoma caproni]|uniref:GLTSCR1 domain-containing protein n=1 Tax=Echinostoma caproni TaxID=27848 RepID=A0A183AS70_9TREM|nr:unnamed protein product [Echinostoma caproni]
MHPMRQAERERDSTLLAGGCRAWAGGSCPMKYEDLSHRREEAAGVDVDRKGSQQVPRQLACFPFESALVSSGWCKRLRHALRTDMHFRANPLSPQVNHDRREKLLNCLLYLHPMCELNLVVQDASDKTDVLADLVQMEKEYIEALSSSSKRTESAAEESDDASLTNTQNTDEEWNELGELASDMLHLIDQIIDMHKNATRHVQSHDPNEL